jgi:hypothetical protein
VPGIRRERKKALGTDFVLGCPEMGSWASAIMELILKTFCPATLDEKDGTSLVWLPAVMAVNRVSRITISHAIRKIPARALICPLRDIRWSL